MKIHLKRIYGLHTTIVLCYKTSQNKCVLFGSMEETDKPLFLWKLSKNRRWGLDHAIASLVFAFKTRNSLLPDHDFTIQDFLLPDLDFKIQDFLLPDLLFPDLDFKIQGFLLPCFPKLAHLWKIPHYSSSLKALSNYLIKSGFTSKQVCKKKVSDRPWTAMFHLHVISFFWIKIPIFEIIK